MDDLVTCKNEEDPIKNEGARVRLLVSCVAMREQKNDEKGYLFSSWAVRSTVII